MSQNKQGKPKALIKFHADDFLKFSKHRIVEKKTNKKILDKTNSFTNSMCYNDKDTKTETTLEDDKDKIIRRLNHRINELETRIIFLEAQKTRNKESITPNPRSTKFLTVSNSTSALKGNMKINIINKPIHNQQNNQDLTSPNKLFNDKLLNKNRINMFFNLKALNKSNIKDKSIKLTIRKQSVDSYFNSCAKTEQSIDNGPHKIRHTYMKTEEGCNELKREQSTSSIASVSISEKASMDLNLKKSSAYNTFTSGNYIKTIPKIPKKINTLVNQTTPVKTIKEQLNEIKERTQTVFNELLKFTNAQKIMREDSKSNNNMNTIESSSSKKSIFKDKVKRSLSENKHENK